MIKKFWFLFLILIIEGASLMSVELMGAKLLAPFYGSSLYVWTTILATTVLGLTFGYYFGGRFTNKTITEKRIVLILSIAALLVLLLPMTASFLISMTSGFGLFPGICVASLFLLVPPLFCFGLVGPMVVRLMAQRLETVGNVAGTTYFISTLGGIVATFLFGYVLIPEFGLKFSSLATGLSLAIIPATYYLRIPFKKQVAHEKEQVVSPSTFETENFQVNAKKKPQAKSKIKKSTIEIKTSFYWFAVLEGGAGMAVELLSARMLTPYFGSSLYVWVAVIGITLLSLAIGYLLGGVLAGKRPGIQTIYWVLLLASAFIASMPFLSEHLTIALMNFDIRISAIVVCILFLLPAEMFLGMVPTLLIRYLTNRVEHAGATTGRVFTLSSASAILALPIMGFFIIPHFGLTGPSIGIGVLIAFIPFVKLIGQKRYLALLFILIFLFATTQRVPFKSSPNLKVQYYSEGLLGQVLVADVLKNEEISTNERSLFINRMGQTIVDKKTNSTKWNYIIFTSALASKLPVNSNALILGLGGGSAANFFINNLNFQVDAVELDKRIGDISSRYFSLDPKVNIIIDDARHYLETSNKTYDVIFFDVFRGDVQPAHVLSLECFNKAKSLLSKNGLIIINFNGFLTGEIGKPGRSVLATLRAAGLHAEILPTPGKEEERNSLFIASKHAQSFSNVRSPLLHDNKPVAINSLLIDIRKLDWKDAIILTDDKPVLERLNMKANENWRNAYNKLNSHFFMTNGVPLFN